MAVVKEKREEVVIKFAGDSGDGMQLVGGQFTNNTAITGSDLGTFPDFPAEIRAPAGTLAGVSGFQIHFSSKQIYTSGDKYDVLVAMNSAALKANIKELKKGGILIVNSAGFDDKNLRLAGYESNPLDEESLSNYQLIDFDITKLTREALEDIDLGMRDKDRSKNMTVLGFLYWMYDRSMDNTIKFLKKKFADKPEVLEANIKALKAGYNYGETSETFSTRYEVEPAKLEPGSYRGVTGNHATVLGLLAASKKSNLPLFCGAYPITPASEILHELSKYKNMGVRTFQAEDEIAAICTVIGASFGGQLAITATSGPGMALKAEALGLAVILELPLVVCNIQRAGPSTGMPTKTEQSDLMQAMYGRNGESPIPIVASSSPSDCFEAVFEACRIALTHMVPVIFLSDGYLANGAEPWKYPKTADLPEIKVTFAKKGKKEFEPYARDKNLVRPWAIPGTVGLEHRVGGLEKENITGNISYDPDNHELMTKIREEKVEKIADDIPLQKIDVGAEKGDILVIGWGSTHGVIKSVLLDLVADGHQISNTHLRYI
ncbi:MAG: 2-oxoacid:acceptor oxidoreductase subunit alpha, partial [Bacteroidetes bacterium]|nr:2-oxoacid:acceptor oxidoreductase subunit alpha [Bacteroidota bacterium]